jgi:hypothetical protein
MRKKLAQIIQHGILRKKKTESKEGPESEEETDTDDLDWNPKDKFPFRKKK